MSGFTNDTNTGRVAKMCDTLGLLAKSAKSNRADQEEIHQLLIPLLAKLGDLGFYAGPGAGPDPEPRPCEERLCRPDNLQRGGPRVAKPTWVSVREMAEQAPLKDLGVALAVYMNRVDEALAEVD